MQLEGGAGGEHEGGEGECEECTFDLGVRRPLEAEGVGFLHFSQLVQAHGIISVIHAGK